ncbi:MAG: S-adenosylmethionine:tRNA ribosyltransferase-isomerase [Actinomycetota bacterium]
MSAVLEHSPPPLFEVPPEREAAEPAEARGLDRDDVRLMVAYRHGERLVHARFRDLPRFLRRGDLLVLNTSRTLPAAVPASTPEGDRLELHLSTRLPDGSWLVELRRPQGPASVPFRAARAGQRILLPAGGSARLASPFEPDGGSEDGPVHRLWLAEVRLPEKLVAYLARHGQPIRYSHVRASWPLSTYQTVYSDEPGSAEMPSAGRAFTPELLTRLMAAGVVIAPILLHTGVSSQEEDEPPYPEFFRVPDVTARLVNAAREWGGRVVAIGTTVVRALEAAADESGVVAPREGWTDLMVTPERGIRAVDGLLTGWHSRASSHLLLLEAVAGRALLEASYRAAIRGRYLWHEFGDLHLVLP